MASSPLVYICSFFMLGRNLFSIIFKIKDFLTEERRKEIKENKKDLFIYIALILTAILGLISGIGLLLPNQIFGYYLFIFVSGMMIYAYITYAGITFEEKNWIMFIVSIFVIIVTIILASLLIVYLVTEIN